MTGLRVAAAALAFAVTGVLVYAAMYVPAAAVAQTGAAAGRHGNLFAALSPMIIVLAAAARHRREKNKTHG